MPGSDLSLLDPDEYHAEFDRRARERRDRRAERAARRPRRARRTPRIPRLRRPATGGGDGLRETTAGRVLVGLVVALAVVTVVGLAVLWPRGAHPHARAGAMGGPTKGATVVSGRDVDCGGPTRQQCRQVVVEVQGRRSPITLGPVELTPKLSPGQNVRVAPVPGSAGRWSFVSVDRRLPMLWLGLFVVLLSVAVIRLRGLLALVGVGLSLLLVTSFLVPAILDGRPAVLVALVAALAVMFITLVLTNGFGPQTLAAALGIGMTLAATAGLALVAVHTTTLDGHSSDLATYLSQQAGAVSLTGVMLAGMVIGALGVLADTAVTQASAVMALRKANPSLGARALYGAAFSVGRDHLSATIHTLVLAYVGAALPLLLVLRSSGVSATDALSTQDLAEPIVATLVGCAGLIAAVPVTTALAAVLTVRVPPQALGEVHTHAH